MEPILKSIGVLLFAAAVLTVVFLIGVPFAMLQAFVMLKLWAWFVVPLGVRMVSFWQVMGLLLIIGFIRMGLKSEGNDEEDVWGKIWRGLAVSTIWPLASWAFGTVYHHFMITG